MHVLPLHRTYLMKPLIIILMIYVFIAQQLYKASSVQPLTASGISSVSLALSLSLSFLSLPLALTRTLSRGCVGLLIHTRTQSGMNTKADRFFEQTHAGLQDPAYPLA